MGSSLGVGMERRCTLVGRGVQAVARPGGRQHATGTDFAPKGDVRSMVMALEGLKVLDLSRLAPGPHCSMLLADFGAEVTLVEAVPGASAKLGTTGLRRSEAADRAAAFNALGRGKRSIALNLKEEEARRIFYRMVEGADVVIEGFRPGVVKRLGVDYETLS
ncbi:MAG: hypothetical protein C4321_08590, partial [Chloroflexota bacterium]